MKALWLFVVIIVFCVYVLFGLYLTESANTIVEIILSWIIYTVLWTTFINVFILGYFWSVLKDKKGPVGLRGPSGERGEEGIQGQCNISASQEYHIKSVNDYINELYKIKTNKSILDESLQLFPNMYLNNKISKMAGSRQYNVIIANLSNENKPVIGIINYLKSIWYQWFSLIYDATDVPGAWFTDKYADEEYTWIGSNNPFDEIKKYDIYYWGVTRDFRPLKAEICRSQSKLPMSNNQLFQPRLKVIQTNDYWNIGYDRHSGVDGSAGFFQAKPIEIGTDSYYPLGSIMTGSNDRYTAWYPSHSEVIIGDFKYYQPTTGPYMRTLLVSGDVKSPENFTLSSRYGGDDDIQLFTPVCPKGYIDLGDVVSRAYGNASPKDNNIKCIPKDCVDKVDNQNISYPWAGSGNNYVLNTFTSGNYDANGENGYNLFRGSSSKPFYKIKDSCLAAPTADTLTTKELEPHNDNLGIGWYGHPYKLDPKYSIFTYLNLIPEGLIVHQGTGRRFYIVYYGRDLPNIYNVLDYNNASEKYDKALKVDDNIENAHVKSRKLNSNEPRQQWNIILKSNNNKLNKLQLKNLYNNKFLYLGLDPITGKSIFSTVNIANYEKDPTFSKLSKKELDDGTFFSFIPSVGTNLNIIDNNDNNDNDKK